MLDFARRYAAERPGRFRWIFLGKGDVPLPHEPWLESPGRVDEERKQAILREASALVQLSINESLSIVALEAWAQGTPVIAHANCAALAGQIARSLGGQTVGDYADFARALDDLWDHPEKWADLGVHGKEYVKASYLSRADYAGRLERAVADLRRPLASCMRERGLERARFFSRDAWRERFGNFVEQLLDSVPRPVRPRLTIEPLHQRLSASAGQNSLFVPVRIHNRGNHALVPDGPGAATLVYQMGSSEQAVPIPNLLVPGRSDTAALLLELPKEPGVYNLDLWAELAGEEIPDSRRRLELNKGGDRITPAGGCGPWLDIAQEALAQARRLERLPTDYADITLGRFARCKHWLKQKFLGQFKHAYVDVLSRQQSSVNARLVAAVAQLAECCATLDHAVRTLQEKLGTTERGQSSQMSESCQELGVANYDNQKEPRTK